MKKILTFVAAGAALLFTACNKDYNVNLNNNIDVTLEGFIFDSDGNIPVSEATVVIGDKETKTNEEGYYKVGGLKSGSYAIKVEKSGYFTEVHSDGLLAQDYYGDAYQLANPIYIEKKEKSITIEIAIPSLEYDDDQERFVQSQNNDFENLWEAMPGSGVIAKIILSDDTYLYNEITPTITAGKIQIDSLPANSMIDIDLEIIINDNDGDIRFTSYIGNISTELTMPKRYKFDYNDMEEISNDYEDFPSINF